MVRYMMLLLVMLPFSLIGQILKEKTNKLTVDFSTVGEEPEKINRKYRALIMGVSHYQYEGPNFQSLDRPAQDAQEVYNTITQFYSFDPSDVILLKDPTRQQIIDALDNLAHATGESDNLLVFYAGHGYWDKSRELGYWLPSDARPDSRSNWISNSDIKDNLSFASIKSKHTLLITDACFGGSIFKSRAISAERFVQINELYREPSRKAMTSGNLSAVPDKSIFLQQLIKKLRENEDDYLPAMTLFTRIYEPVMNNSAANPVYGVIQGAGDEGGDFIFERRKK
ncbi:MAG: caspase family protein [Bacteroidetes bacterium]|nr:caspase family protein [Bacteroidota bacterium]